MTKKRNAAQAEARSQLLKMLRPGDTVYTILRHVSSSGMTRDISLVILQRGGRGQPATIRNIDYYAATLMGYTRRSSGEGIRVGGCGMDMGFHLVYNLGHSMWPNGTRKPHGTRNGEPDTDGGYALKHRWL